MDTPHFPNAGWALLGAPVIPTANVPMFRNSDNQGATIPHTRVFGSSVVIVTMSGSPNLTALRLIPTTGESFRGDH